MYENKRGIFLGAVSGFALFSMLFCLLAVSQPAWGGKSRGEGYIDGRSLKDFTGVGRIDSMKKDRLVINDTSQTLSPQVKYYIQGRIKTSRSSFKVGTRVGYVTNSKGEIISLWLIRESRR